jgi:hypothetical protein
LHVPFILRAKLQKKRLVEVMEITEGSGLICMIFSFGSCAGKIAFLKSVVVPTARDEAKVNTNRNKNYVKKI